jgi:ferric-dicitrate binding protein FerR (iron transport regulator)
MNEFEWRRQMRDLRQSRTPQRDLWASIDAALDDVEFTHAPTIQAAPAQQPAHRRRWLVAGALAASVLLACGIGWHLQHAPAATPLASTATPPWKPADPRLAGAAIELDAARMELQMAIQQSPDSPLLQRLLNRTEHQQTQLHQLASQAG